MLKPMSQKFSVIDLELRRIPTNHGNRSRKPYMKTVILKPAPAMEIWIWDRCIYRARSRSSGRVRTSYLRFSEIDLESFGKLFFGVFCGGRTFQSSTEVSIGIILQSGNFVVLTPVEL